MDNENRSPRVAVLIPCFNEEATIAAVVRDFRAALPSADIYVCDNNSTDRTVERAQAACAHILHERRRGKGCVVKSMFRQVDADVYLMVDGDCTYPSEAAQALVTPVVRGQADMVIGSRLHAGGIGGLSMPHLWGNRLAVFLSHLLFGITISDLLSGYRALSRSVAHTVPLTSEGFEIETELTIRTIEQGFRVIDVPVGLQPRPAGSMSKIRFVRDGCAIVSKMLSLFHATQQRR